MIATELLPIRKMHGTDWEKIHSGFVITGSSDWHIPLENIYVTIIVNYLFNKQLNIVNYTTQFNAFSFCVWAFGHKNDHNPRIDNIKNFEQDENYFVLSLSVHVDADRFQNANRQESLQMIAQLMLDSIPNYLFNRTDFDGEKFYDDIFPILKPIADGTRTFQDEEFPL